jgi:hypothetical protein
MQLKETKNYLNKFGKFVIQQARTRLSKSKKNVSKELYKSLEYLPYQKGDVVGVKFFMEDYGKFVDQGVKGANPNRLPKGSKRYGKQQAPNSPFTFGSGKGGGLRKGITNWIRKRNIKGRDKKGRFITRKSLRYMIVRSIYLSGIKPSMFFTIPFQQGVKKLPKELQEKFVTDLENIIFE